MKAAVDWPRYMKSKRLKNGATAYYWEPHQRDRARGFSLHSEPLGQDYTAARDRATQLNRHLDAWRDGLETPRDIDESARTGTIDWWIESYARSEAFERLSKRSRADYRGALSRLAELSTAISDPETGHVRPVGELPVSSLSPAAVDKIYKKLRQNGAVTRQANYTIDVARIAWRVVARAHPGLFLLPIEGPEGRQLTALNPFVGVSRVHGHGTTKPATRAEAFSLADALARIGHPALGVVALVAFEWLQRPENVISGHLTWTQYRPAERPCAVEIFHHKTGGRIWQPLEDEAGRRLYPELESHLAALPRLGVPIVVFVPQRGPKNPNGERTARLYSESYADHLVQQARAAADLPKHLTLAACRHGGMTLLGDAEITEQGVMALSGHATPAAARLYVKRTEAQRLAAAVKRRDWLETHRLAERSGIDSGNNGRDVSGNRRKSER